MFAAQVPSVADGKEWGCVVDNITACGASSPKETISAGGPTAVAFACLGQGIYHTVPLTSLSLLSYTAQNVLTRPEHPAGGHLYADNQVVRILQIVYLSIYYADLYHTPLAASTLFHH